MCLLCSVTPGPVRDARLGFPGCGRRVRGGKGVLDGGELESFPGDTAARGSRQSLQAGRVERWACPDEPWKTQKGITTDSSCFPTYEGLGVRAL